MQYEFLLWVAVLVHSIHQLEEVYLDASEYQASVGIPKISEAVFYFAYAIFLLTGVAMAMIGWRAPAFSLMYPLYMMMNVILFHLVMSVKHRNYSPGLLTGLVFIMPVGIACFWGAAKDGVLNGTVVFLALLLAIIYTLIPFVFIRIKKKLNEIKKR